MARFANRYAPAAAVNEARYLIVPCEAEGSRDLAVIWDRLEEQVVDVIDASNGGWSAEDDLWEEATQATADHDWRMAA